MVTFFLLPIFILFVFVTSSEVKKIKTFHEVLDGSIAFEDQILTQSSMMKDRNGNVISEIHDPVARISLASNEIPSFLKDIFITSEDQHFYEHHGFDVAAIGRALAVNMKEDSIEQGASTITQQLARNLFLSHDKTYNRKISELLYAYELERKYTKDDILTFYINDIYYQNGVYGIEAAANYYFQKTTAQLSRAELAFLAAIPNNPSYYDPLTHFDRTKKRQERLIDGLVKQQLLSVAEADSIKQTPIAINTKQKIDVYPDYTTFVEHELKDLISVTEGYHDQLLNATDQEKRAIEKKLAKRVDEVLSSGIVIETNVDPTLQTKSVQAVLDGLPYEDVQGSAVVINHQSHEILALVGGKNYQKYDFNRSYQAYRQPGSAIKPLLDYAPYIERTHAELSDKVNAGSFCSNGYCPKNYGGATYGMVTIEQAFTHSYNTPAVRLLQSTGVESAFQDLSYFHFSKIGIEDHVLSAAIGGFSYGMTPLELTQSYTIFANDGYYQPARSIKRVTDLQGNILYEWHDTPAKIWSKETTDKIRLLMQKTITAGTARKAAFPSTGYTGGKTGTTNDYHDYWFVGLTDTLTSGVWVGQDNPANMKRIESQSPQLLIWRRIMYP